MFIFKKLFLGFFFTCFRLMLQLARFFLFFVFIASILEDEDEAILLKH